MRLALSALSGFAVLIVGLLMTPALLMTALLITIVAAAALLRPWLPGLRPWLPGRLLALAPNFALLVSISLILISISHVFIVFYVATRHERYSSVVDPSAFTLGLPTRGSNRNRG